MLQRGEFRRTCQMYIYDVLNINKGEIVTEMEQQILAILILQLVILTLTSAVTSAALRGRAPCRTPRLFMSLTANGRKVYAHGCMMASTKAFTSNGIPDVHSTLSRQSAVRAGDGKHAWWSTSDSSTLSPLFPHQSMHGGVPSMHGAVGYVPSSKSQTG